jgi:hypothetical protein
MAKVTVEKETGALIGKESVKNIQLWQSRIRSHLEFLKKHWNGWESWKAAYLLDRAIHWGEAKTIVPKAQDLNAEVTVPIIANHIRNLMPFLFSKNPVFYGFPSRKDIEAIEDSKAQIDYLNSVWEEQGMTRQARRSVLDAAIIGHGIVRTGFGYDLELPVTKDITKKGNINYLEYITEENPYIRRINPFLFLFDRMSPDSDLSSARWCCEIIIQTTQDLIDNELYDKNVRKKIETGEVDIMRVMEFNSKYHKETEEDLSFLFAEQKEVGEGLENPDSLCIVYKVYDRKFGNIFTLNPSYDEEVLSINQWEPTYGHLKSFPFLKVDFEEVPNEPYGIGHVRYLADLAHQIQRNRTKIYAVSRMFNPKYVHTGPQKLDPTEQEKIDNDQPGMVVNLNPGCVLGQFPIPTNSRDLYEATSILDKDYSEVSGEDVLARGGLLPSRTSAEEIRERRRLRGLRLETNVENTHTFILQIANQVLLHSKRFATKDRVVQVIGRPGEFWSEVSVLQLKRGETKLKLELISKDPEPPDVKRRNLMELFNIIANPNIYQLLQAQGVQVNMRRLWKTMMDTFGIDEMEHIFPGLNENIDLPNIDLQNMGNQPGMSNGQPASTTEMQTQNVSPESALQGSRGLEAIFGNLNPTAF